TKRAYLPSPAKRYVAKLSRRGKRVVLWHPNRHKRPFQRLRYKRKGALVDWIRGSEHAQHRLHQHHPDDWKRRDGLCSAWGWNHAGVSRRCIIVPDLSI